MNAEGKSSLSPPSPVFPLRELLLVLATRPSIAIVIGDDTVAREWHYQGRIIRATSYQTLQNTWLSQAEIVTTTIEGIRRQSVSATQQYATQAEADARARELAQEFIDSQIRSR
jgi:hypothetical protein